MKILLAVDGSEHSARVARHVVKMAQGCPAYEILLLNVQAPIDAPEVLGHMPAREVEAMQETRGGDAMGSARSILDAAGVTYVPEVALGPVPETISRRAAEAKADAIVIGTQGASALRSALMGSVTTEVLRLAGCPVTVVK
ncbi:MAG: universal stress protein [Sulfuritalea sp.]|jgi:nucleotide-binding universal stress UspA family protein|nr:universal stress protein [Sulfuritalea sp.]MBK9349577.1 universal stress protein [Sulfuritalea sp.]